MKAWRVCLVLLLAGCGKEVYREGEPMEPPRRPAAEPQPTAPAPASAIEEAVDTVVIQKGKIHAGVRAAEKVRTLGAQHQKELKEVGAQ